MTKKIHTNSAKFYSSNGWGILYKYWLILIIIGDWLPHWQKNTDIVSLSAYAKVANSSNFKVKIWPKIQVFNLKTFHFPLGTWLNSLVFEMQLMALLIHWNNLDVKPEFKMKIQYVTAMFRKPCTCYIIIQLTDLMSISPDYKSSYFLPCKIIRWKVKTSFTLALFLFKGSHRRTNTDVGGGYCVITVW